MAMRKIEAKEITEAVARLCLKANFNLRPDVVLALKEALGKEDSPRAKDIIRTLLKNASISKKEGLPLCQDTGMVTVFLKIGQGVRIVGGDLREAVNEGVRRAYREGYLRKSVVDDPLIRKNTRDNTPAVIHPEIVPGDKLKVTVLPKGFGAENISALAMLKPSEGKEGVKKFVMDTVRRHGANGCPPLIIGIGLGGTMEKAALLAKEAILRPLGSHHRKRHIAILEKELLREINKLGIGPQGLGGETTVLGVKVEVYPTHIAGLPVAVNISCHALRQASTVL